MKKLLTVFLSAMLLAFTSWAQTQSVTGTVTDAASNDPIPGVSVVVKGTAVGAVTNIDGKFTLNLEETVGSLQFTFIGMKPQEVEISGPANLSIKMEPDVIGLEEVVAIGYGSSKVKDLTAPIATVSADEIAKMSSSTAMSAVQGAVAGVQVVESGISSGRNFTS